MIDDLDEALRRLLIREMPIKNGEIDIKFEQPKREWTARLNRPTLNLFMYKIEENQKLRQTQPMWETVTNEDGTVSKRLKPVRMDMHYMVTAWAADPEDEHRLLGRALTALLRYQTLPENAIPDNLRDQPVEIPIMVAKQDELQDTSLMWSSLDNEMKPSVSCVVTPAVNPYQFYPTPLVRTRMLRVGQSPEPVLEKFDELAGREQFWTIGGTVRSKHPLETLRLTLVDRGIEIPIRQDGNFVIGHVQEGEYTLSVAVDGQELHRFRIAVPSPDYILEV